MEDALKYLSEMMKRWKENAVMNDNETVLDRYYEGYLSYSQILLIVTHAPGPEFYFELLVFLIKGSW